MKKYKFNINENEYNVEIVSVDDNGAKVVVNGETYEVGLEQQVKTTKTPTLTRSAAVPSTDSTPSTVRTANPADLKGAATLKSPLPGKIIDIFVKEGDKVTLGQTVICLEAMKMENNINTDREGVVKTIHVQKGDTVYEGDKLIEIG